MRPDFDVIVVGAGAGGAAAAYYLIRAGLRVLVVEKARLPRYKACGGAIPRQTLDRFPFDFESVIRASPTGVRFAFPGLPPVDAPLPGQPIAMVMRSEFDAFLLERAGAEVLDGIAVASVAETDRGVRVGANGRTFTARYLVGADGAVSRVASGLGLRRNRQLGGTLEAEVPLARQAALRERYGARALFSLAVIPWGYAWVFPKGECLSVGIGQFRPGRANLRAALSREMDRLGIHLDGAELHGHPLPCYQTRRWPLWSAPFLYLRGRRAVGDQEKISTRRCLLIGDAAGLVDPLIGEGIRYAIASARIAAQAIARDDLRGYETVIWREIGHSLGTAGLTAEVFYRWPTFCYQVGVRNPVAVRQFVELLMERYSYHGVGRRLIGSALRWLLRGPGNERH